MDGVTVKNNGAGTPVSASTTGLRPNEQDSSSVPAQLRVWSLMAPYNVRGNANVRLIVAAKSIRAAVDLLNRTPEVSVRITAHRLKSCASVTGNTLDVGSHPGVWFTLWPSRGTVSPRYRALQQVSAK